MFVLMLRCSKVMTILFLFRLWELRNRNICQADFDNVSERERISVVELSSEAENFDNGGMEQRSFLLTEERRLELGRSC